jgi:hypothetical protein
MVAWHRCRDTILLLSSGALGLCCSLVVDFPSRPRASGTPAAASGLEGDRRDLDAGEVEARDGGELGAGDGGEPDGGDDPSRSTLLAFIENTVGEGAQLRLVDVDQPSRPIITLRANSQVGDALDFKWSPDGQRIALRHLTSQGEQLAFFGAPRWGAELAITPTNEVTLLGLRATPRYEWSPTGSTLAVELTNGRAEYVGGFTLHASGDVVPLSPDTFGPLQADPRWFTSSELFVALSPAASDGLGDAGLSRARGWFIAVHDGLVGELRDSAHEREVPLEVRRLPAGVWWADRSGASFFWGAEFVAPKIFNPPSFLSALQNFVAVVDPLTDTAAVYPLGPGVFAAPLVELPACRVVLAWGEGPSADSLQGSRIACLTVPNGAAHLTLYSFAESLEPSSTSVTSAELLADLSDEANWIQHARAFSPTNDWLALATAEHDFILNAAGEVFVDSAESNVPTARNFSPDGRTLIQLRGAEMTVIPLRSPSIAVASDTVRATPACHREPHLFRWCGSPVAVASTSNARWASSGVLVLLEEGGRGLSVAAVTADGVALERRHVSPCGADCIVRYAVNVDPALHPN